MISNYKNIDYTTLDLNPKNYAYAENCIKADITNMPFGDKVFDVIIHNQVLEHISDEKKCIYECMRVLKDDGMMIINIPYQIGLERTFEDDTICTDELREKFYYLHDHVRLYGADMLTGYFDLNIERIYESVFPNTIRLLMALERSETPSKLSDAYFVIKKQN